MLTKAELDILSDNGYTAEQREDGWWSVTHPTKPRQYMSNTAFYTFLSTLHPKNVSAPGDYYTKPGSAINNSSRTHKTTNIVPPVVSMPTQPSSTTNVDDEATLTEEAYQKQNMKKFLEARNFKFGNTAQVGTSTLTRIIGPFQYDPTKEYLSTAQIKELPVSEKNMSPTQIEELAKRLGWKPVLNSGDEDKDDAAQSKQQAELHVPGSGTHHAIFDIKYDPKLGKDMPALNKLYVNAHILFDSVFHDVPIMKRFNLWSIDELAEMRLSQADVILQRVNTAKRSANMLTERPMIDAYADYVYTLIANAQLDRDNAYKNALAGRTNVPAEVTTYVRNSELEGWWRELIALDNKLGDKLDKGDKEAQAEMERFLMSTLNVKLNERKEWALADIQAFLRDKVGAQDAE